MVMLSKSFNETLETFDFTGLLQGQFEASMLNKRISTDGFVPDFGFNILNRMGLLYRPVVDEKRLSSGMERPTWPDGKPFAVCLTHDVDHVSANSCLQVLRAAWRSVGQTSSKVLLSRLFKVGVQLRSSLARKKDPFHCYEKWLELEAQVGAHSTFFFLPNNVSRTHYTDGEYQYKDRVYFEGKPCQVGEMIHEIDRRGWEIGLHASWYAYDDAAELRRQKEQLEAVIGHGIVSIRQHYLHYDIRKTPQTHAEAGFHFDSTLGFNDNVGFRFGTSYPWQLYNLVDKTYISTLEIPLIVQDGALLNSNKGLRVDETTAFQYIVQLTDAVERVGGVLTLLWHADSVAIPARYNLYHQVLEFLRSRNAWFGSVGEIGKWWEERAFPANGLRSRE